MRVALVSSGFPPEIGGIEAYVRHLAEELTVIGCDVDVLTQCPRNKVDEWGATDSHVQANVLRFGDWTGTRQFRIAPGLWKYLRTRGGEYDVINVHNFHASPAIATAWLTDRPLVFTPYYHGVGHTTVARMMHFPYDKLARRIFARATFVLCVSEAERDLVVRDNPSIASRVHTVGIGVDTEDIRASIPYKLDRPVVLMIGRLEGYKNVQTAIDAFALCKAEAELVVVGTGPQKNSLLTHIRALGLNDQIRVIGPLQEEDLRRWQRTAHVVVSLSSAESFGLVVAEGIVAGARVIASDIPAHRALAGMTGSNVELLRFPLDVHNVRDALLRALAAPTLADAGPGVPTWPEVAERTFDLLVEAQNRKM